MTKNQAKKYLQNKFNIPKGNEGLLVLHAVKENIRLCGGNDSKTMNEQGEIIINFANCHKLTNSQLLEFFGTTLEAVIQEAGEEFIQEQGLYRALITSPHLSPVCELFSNAWMTASFSENQMRCRISRIGIDSFKLTATLPGNKETTYPKTLTANEVAKYSDCTIEALRDMPTLN